LREIDPYLPQHQRYDQDHARETRGRSSLFAFGPRTTLRQRMNAERAEANWIAKRANWLTAARSVRCVRQEAYRRGPPKTRTAAKAELDFSSTEEIERVSTPKIRRLDTAITEHDMERRPKSRCFQSLVSAGRGGRKRRRRRVRAETGKTVRALQPLSPP